MNMSKKVVKPTRTVAQKVAPTPYKRGTLSGVMRNYLKKFFDKTGNFEGATYAEAEKLAHNAMPTTKFNKYHWSWYKNKLFAEFSADKKAEVKQK